jgi:U4/U6.U5 tri-snRNP-associated protein 1
MEDSTNNVEAEQEKPEDIDFAGGLASTLSFLKSKNAVKDKSISEVNKERETVEVKKAAELNKLKLAISQRIHKESLEKDSNLRKLSNKERELFIKKELEQFKSLQGPEDIKHKLDNYKPEISLKYIDELGREMNTKEAYKHLSHQFHGKAPNKSKVEKKLKKFEQERNVQKNEKLLD